MSFLVEMHYFFSVKHVLLLLLVSQRCWATPLDEQTNGRGDEPDLELRLGPIQSSLPTSEHIETPSFHPSKPQPLKPSIAPAYSLQPHLWPEWAQGRQVVQPAEQPFAHSPHSHFTSLVANPQQGQPSVHPSMQFREEPFIPKSTLLDTSDPDLFTLAWPTRDKTNLVGSSSQQYPLRLTGERTPLSLYDPYWSKIEQISSAHFVPHDNQKETNWRGMSQFNKVHPTLARYGLRPISKKPAPKRLELSRQMQERLENYKVKYLSKALPQPFRDGVYNPLEALRFKLRMKELATLKK